MHSQTINATSKQISPKMRGTKSNMRLHLRILCVMRPSGKPWKGHMTTNDAIKIIEQAHPEQAVLTHFGMKMIFKGPAREAKLIEKETSVSTIATKDGMRIKFGETIGVQASRKVQQDLNRFF